MASPASSGNSVFRVAAAFEGAMLLIAWGLGIFLERPPLSQIHLSARDAALGVAAAAPLWLGLVLITRYPVGPFKALNQVVEDWVLPLFERSTIWQLAGVSALAGAGEEALFRGLLQGGIEQFSGSSLLALLVASALFGLAHAITSTYAVLAGVIGAYLGWLWLATDNLLAPMITHAVYDFVALVYLLRLRGDHAGDQPADALANDDFGIV